MNRKAQNRSMNRKILICILVILAFFGAAAAVEYLTGD